MSKRKLSPLQREYRAFFLKMLEEYEVNSPAQLDYEKKRKFFTRLREGWKQIKKEKIKTSSSEKKSKLTKDSTSRKVSDKSKSEKSANPKQILDEIEDVELVKEIILSEPNPEQTNDLRIKYIPNNFFHQEEALKYPIVVMPPQNSLLKLPRKGRSNNKGYTEGKFTRKLSKKGLNISLSTDQHLAIPNFNQPYEPDIILFDNELNLFIDIEIDEPYDGYFRYPRHFRDREHILKGKDRVRDLFFAESGWVVIRFTEKQIYKQPDECILFIQDVIDSIRQNLNSQNSNIKEEPLWDYQQGIRWEKDRYREKYLDIDSFEKVEERRRVIVNVEEEELQLNRTEIITVQSPNNEVAFDEDSHIYMHPKDKTGNAEYISVTTLVDRFFPFDLEGYFERKSNDENISIEIVRAEFEKNRKEAAEKGTYLHEQIENFLNKTVYDSQFKEFDMFNEFYENKILKKDFHFVEAEKKIVSKEHNIAGTVDAIFRNETRDTYFILDWKRSKKLVIDGHPDMRGFPIQLEELADFNNCSYYKYLLQQNIYKYILEKEFNMAISSIRLVVLHEKYDTYFLIKLPIITSVVETIFNSINTKI